MHSKFETDVLRVGAHQYTYYPLVQVASKDVREDLPASTLCVIRKCAQTFRSES